MTENVSPPGVDPAESGSLAAVLSGVFQAFKRDDLDGLLPAIVEDYDRQSNRARVRPIVKMLTTDGQARPRASVASIPVFRFGAGGFFIAMPVKRGDFGWILAADRDLSLVLQQGPREEIPNTATFHNFSSGWFIPDTFRSWAIDGANADALVIQTMDGSVCVALHEGKLTFTAPAAEFNIPETTWKGNVTLEGGLSASNGVMTHNGVNIGAQHKHSGVEPGPGTSGDPV